MGKCGYFAIPLTLLKHRVIARYEAISFKQVRHAKSLCIVEIASYLAMTIRKTWVFIGIFKKHFTPIPTELALDTIYKNLPGFQNLHTLLICTLKHNPGFVVFISFALNGLNH